MIKSFYLKFAIDGIKKNKQIYYPYLLAGICMAMVFFVFLSLAISPVVYQLPGKEVLPYLLKFGATCTGFFSIPFLFYTNASLIKKRKKELGLYNILGLNKKNIMHMMLWETVISYGVVILLGSVLGTILSKVSEFVLTKIMNRNVDIPFTIGGKTIFVTAIVFFIVYALILLNSYIQIRKNKPIDLLHSDMEGEKAPKKSWALTLLSIVFIGIGYFYMNHYHMQLFASKLYIAVLFITIGSFLFFICASVFICKYLQNRKGYYYKTANFATVSAMTFRMKRNGAGVAAICIFTTLILATSSLALCFYVACRDITEYTYPHAAGISVSIPVQRMADEMDILEYKKTIQGELEKILDAESNAKYAEAYSANMMGVIEDGLLDMSIDMHDTWFQVGNDVQWIWEEGNQKLVFLHFISTDTYNQFCGTNETLQDNEVMFASKTVDYGKDEIRLFNGDTIHVSKKTKQMPPMRTVRIEDISMNGHGCEDIYVVVNDLYSLMGNVEGLKHYDQCNYLLYDWSLEFDWAGKDDSLREVYQGVTASIDNMKAYDENVMIAPYLKLDRQENLFSIAGAVLFLAVNFNLLFLVVISLIMYYKQLSEGYEDQKRFEIMKKVGMTQKEIKASIRSQIKIVFTLPLLVGAVHFMFTPKVIKELVEPATAIEMNSVLAMMVISFVIFVLFYSVAYLFTSKKYYKIVNGYSE